MTDEGETPEEQPNAGETPAGKGETPEEPGDDLDGLKSALAKERELRRRHEAEAKTNADAAAELAKLKDADKTEVQRLSEKAKADAERADTAEARLMRLEVALEKGVPHKMAGRLQGTTREELEADADELLKDLKPGTGSGETPTGRPRERLRSGTAPDSEPEETDPAKLAEMVPRA